MIIFVALLLTALTFAFVAYPLFRQRRRSTNPAVDGKLGELLSSRDTAYSMLKELEFDLQSGILSKEDYQELEARYKSKAISVLKGIDGLEEAGDVEADIERQVLELRRFQGSLCPQCGDKRQPNDRSCPRCGASLNKGEPVD
jgi:hypothetical protein